MHTTITSAHDVMAEFALLMVVFWNLVQGVLTTDGMKTCAVFGTGAVDEGDVVIIVDGEG